MTPLDKVLNRFFALIKDTDLAKLSDEDLLQLSIVYYEMAATRFKECKKNLELKEIDGVMYIMDELTTEEQNILAQGCVLYWVESKANYNKLMKNQINTKDYNQLSNANVLLRLNELLDYYRKNFLRQRKAYSRRINDDFNGWG